MNTGSEYRAPFFAVRYGRSTYFRFEFRLTISIFSRRENDGGETEEVVRGLEAEGTAAEDAGDESDATAAAALPPEAR